VTTPGYDASEHAGDPTVSSGRTHGDSGLAAQPKRAVALLRLPRWRSGRHGHGQHHSFGDTGLTVNTTYAYTAVAYDARSTNRRRSRIKCDHHEWTPPTTPGTPTLTSATSTSVRIAGAVHLHRRVAGYKNLRNGILAGTVSGTTTSFTDTG